MEYFEKLVSESIYGNDDSFAELRFEAGAGNTEAQYYLALFYKKTGGNHDPDYLYWNEKYQASVKRDKRLWDYYSTNPILEIKDLFGCIHGVSNIYSIISLFI